MNAVRSKREENKWCSINTKNWKETEKMKLKKNKKFGLMVGQCSVIHKHVLFQDVCLLTLYDYSSPMIL